MVAPEMKKAPQFSREGYDWGMTEDQMYRAAIVGFAMPIWAFLIQKAKTYLSAARDKEGRVLIERIGYRLGSLWARANRRT